MYVVICIIGLFLGYILKIIISKVSLKISFSEDILGKKKTMKLCNYFIVPISLIVFLISFLKFGVSFMLLKVIVLDSILIIVSFIDIQYQIIPNGIVIITLIFGILATFICDISFITAVYGMLLGGGVIFLLALIPNAMGGGDVKLMFAIGGFLGPRRVLVALFVAFILASIISIGLLAFKIKGRKEHIPFGPFLAFGCFIAIHIEFLL